MIQLDTHTLLWRELDSSKLSERARLAILASHQAREEIAISAATIWEVAHLASRGRIQLAATREEFLSKIEEDYRVIPISAKIAIEAAGFIDPFPKDPMDRLIAGTARALDFELITADQLILRANVCKVLW